MKPNLVLVLRVRDKQVIEFVGKPLHMTWYFGVINIIFFFTSAYVLEKGDITCVLKLGLLFNFELRIYVICVSKSLVMSYSP